MTCSDVDRILPEIIDGGPIEGAQDFEFQSHLRTCPDCSELVSDLKLIASESRQLSDTEEPPSRVWVRIAAELRAEGLIRDPELPRAQVVAPVRQRRWDALWFAPVAIVILAAGSYLMHHKATASVQSRVAKQSPSQQPEAQVAQQRPDSAPTAQTPAAQASPPTERAEVSPPPTGDDLQFLSEVSERAPAMRVNYENQLQAVNHEIQETQAYIREHPGDGDARQHLMEVFQQKAMLYQMALDRIQ
jgi:hypothetical protein